VCGDSRWRVLQCVSLTQRHLLAGDLLSFRAWGFVVLRGWFDDARSGRLPDGVADPIGGRELAEALAARPVRRVAECAPGQGWYQDAARQPNDEFVLQVWQESLRAGDGPRFLPGSHALPLGLGPRDVALAAGADPRSRADDLGGVAVEVEPGDVIALDARLWRQQPRGARAATRTLRYRAVDGQGGVGAPTG